MTVVVVDDDNEMQMKGWMTGPAVGEVVADNDHDDYDDDDTRQRTTDDYTHETENAPNLYLARLKIE